MSELIEYSRETWERIVKAVVSEMDYDAGKQLDVTTAEEPDTVEEQVDTLISVAICAVSTL